MFDHPSSGGVSSGWCDSICIIEYAVMLCLCLSDSHMLARVRSACVDAWMDWERERGLEEKEERNNAST